MCSNIYGAIVSRSLGFHLCARIIPSSWYKKRNNGLPTHLQVIREKDTAVEALPLFVNALYSFSAFRAFFLFLTLIYNMCFS